MLYLTDDSSYAVRLNRWQLVKGDRYLKASVPNEVYLILINKFQVARRTVLWNYEHELQMCVFVKRAFMSFSMQFANTI